MRFFLVLVLGMVVGWVSVGEPAPDAKSGDVSATPSDACHGVKSMSSPGDDRAVNGVVNAS